MVLTIFSCSKDEVPENTAPSVQLKNYPADPAIDWQKLQLELIRTTPGFYPPIAARAIGYSSVIFYETVYPAIEGKKSFGEAANLGYSLQKPNSDLEINYVLAANIAMREALLKFYPQASAAAKQAIEDLYQQIKTDYSATEDDLVIERSENYGLYVSTEIGKWSDGDGGLAADPFPAGYSLPVGPGYWVPTPPAYQAIPLLPYWGNNRYLVNANSSVSCQPPVPFTYSTIPGSDFYNEANEVYQTSLNLTSDQQAIAKWWADGSATFTPPGHMMNLGSIALEISQSNLADAAEVYLRLGVACNDAFIACWKAKYTHNLMRPVTFIRQEFDAGWNPLIGTPPFPEYTSGHSSVSGAASEVLTQLFGSNFSFVDNTNVWNSMAPRSFNSFYEAADEAAVSRLYGGIHFRNANENGKTCGKQVGKNVMSVNLNR